MAAAWSEKRAVSDLEEIAMSERFAFAIVPGTGWRAREIEDVAKEAEAAGFEAIFSVEANNDGMGTAQLMDAVTKNIKVGTWIASIYLRHSYLCAQGAALIADATGRTHDFGIRRQPSACECNSRRRHGVAAVGVATVCC